MEFSGLERSVRVVDPRMQINQDKRAVIKVGPKNNSYRVLVADSQLNASSVNFSYNATSVSDMIDRRFYVKYYVQVAITGTGTPLTAYGSTDSLRFLPINSSASSIQLTLNNSNISVVPYQWMDGVSRYLPPDVLKNDLAMSPSTPDLLYDYALGAGSKNVMGDYSDNGLSDPDLRGALVPVSSSEAKDASTFQFEICEPLFIPPCQYQEKNKASFVGIDNLALQMNHDWSGATIWSSSSGNTLSSFTVTFYQAPELLLNVMTPNELVEKYDPSKNYIYSSSSIRHYSTQAGTVNAGSSSTVYGGNIQLNCIPSRIYVFARQTRTSKTYDSPDSFLRMTNVSISFGNKTGLLASATANDLYQMSLKNGYQYGFSAWRHYQGSVLCLKPDEDLSLDLGEAPGLVTQKQLQIQATFYNQTANNISVEMIVLPILPSAFYIQNGQASQSVGLLSPEEILTAPVQNFRLSGIENADIYGSGIFDFFKNLISKAVPIVGPILANVLEPLAERGIQEVGKFLTGQKQQVAKKLRGGRPVALKYVEDEEEETQDALSRFRKI